MSISDITELIEDRVKSQIDNLTHIPIDERNRLNEKLDEILDDLDELSTEYGDDESEEDDDLSEEYDA